MGICSVMMALYFCTLFLLICCKLMLLHWNQQTLCGGFFSLKVYNAEQGETAWQFSFLYLFFFVFCVDVDGQHEALQSLPLVSAITECLCSLPFNIQLNN